MERCDVLIVGGGPAGSSCAWMLRSSGLDVLVLDARSFPRDKTCAGWVTPPVLRSLEVDRDEYQNGRTLQPITGFRTGVVGGEEVQTLYGRTVSYGIRRCEFDDFLLKRCSARRRLGEPVKSLKRLDGRWIVNDSLETPLLVGAGGHFCPVARLLGGRQGHRASVVAAQEIEFEVDAAQLDRVRIDPEIQELFFFDDLQGYGWCFRKGNFLNIGLGRLDHDRLGGRVDTFCRFLREHGKVTCDIPARFHGHAYQLYERVQPKLFDEGVLLIGDAAGLAYPQSGEGIRPAVESGLIAAETILTAGGDYERVKLEAYGARLTARLGKPRSSGPADWLPAGWLHFLAARLLSTHWFSRKVVLDRWFLHAGEAAL